MICQISSSPPLKVDSLAYLHGRSSWSYHFVFTLRLAVLSGVVFGVCFFQEVQVTREKKETSWIVYSDTRPMGSVFYL